MFRKGDVVEIQETEGTRTRRRVLTVVQGGDSQAIGRDAFKRGSLVPFTDTQVTTYVRR